MKRYLKKNKPRIQVDSVPVILVDTREKHPWCFTDMQSRSQCLPVGDYTFEGFVGKFVIERKADIQELLSDVAGKNRKWFKSFLARLAKIDTAIIVVEDSADNIDKALSRIGKSEFTGQTLYWLLSYITVRHGISILFVGKNFRTRQGDVETFFHHCYQELKGL